MEYKQLAYYGIQAIKYTGIACGTALAIEGLINGNREDILAGCGSISTATLLLTSDITKSVLGIKDHKSLEDKLE